MKYSRSTLHYNFIFWIRHLLCIHNKLKFICKTRKIMSISLWDTVFHTLPYRCGKDLFVTCVQKLKVHYTLLNRSWNAVTIMQNTKKLISARNQYMYLYQYTYYITENHIGHLDKTDCYLSLRKDVFTIHCVSYELPINSKFQSLVVQQQRSWLETPKKDRIASIPTFIDRTCYLFTYC